MIKCLETIHFCTTITIQPDMANIVDFTDTIIRLKSLETGKKQKVGFVLEMYLVWSLLGKCPGQHLYIFWCIWLSGSWANLAAVCSSFGHLCTNVSERLKSVQNIVKRN